MAPGGDAFANDVVAADDLVFAAGAAQDAAGDYAWTVRIYDAGTGALLSSDDAAGSGSVNGLALDDDHVYAAGYLGQRFGDFSFTVRAYFADSDDDRDDHEKSRKEH